jgi:hypothetical protein
MSNELRCQPATGYGLRSEEELRWLQATGYRRQADPLPWGEGNVAPHPLRFPLLRRGSSCDAQRGADERPLPWGEGNAAERVGEGWTAERSRSRLGLIWRFKQVCRSSESAAGSLLSFATYPLTRSALSPQERVSCVAGNEERVREGWVAEHSHSRLRLNQRFKQRYRPPGNAARTDYFLLTTHDSPVP